MARWIANTPEERLTEVGNIIDQIWCMNIGQDLVKARQLKDKDPKRQALNTIRSAIAEMYDDPAEKIDQINPGSSSMLYDESNFSNVNMTELMEILNQLPEWSKLEEVLSTKEIEEGN